MTFTAGKIVTAADMNDLNINTLTTTGNVTVGGRLVTPYEAYVTGDQTSSANNTTFFNVTDLVLPMAASKGFEFDIFLMYAATAFADFKMTLVGPAGADLTQWQFWGKDAALAAAWGSAAAGGTVAGLGGNGAAVKQQFSGRGVILNGANAGTLQVQVAKNTAEATVLTVFQWSRMRLKPLA